MNTQARPAFAPGITPIFARRRTSSGCIFRNAAASMSESVLITLCPEVPGWIVHRRPPDCH